MDLEKEAKKNTFERRDDLIQIRDFGMTDIRTDTDNDKSSDSNPRFWQDRHYDRQTSRQTDIMTDTTTDRHHDRQTL